MSNETKRNIVVPEIGEGSKAVKQEISIDMDSDAGKVLEAVAHELEAYKTYAAFLEGVVCACQSDSRAQLWQRVGEWRNTCFGGDGE